MAVWTLTHIGKYVAVSDERSKNKKKLHISQLRSHQVVTRRWRAEAGRRVWMSGHLVWYT